MSLFYLKFHHFQHARLSRHLPPVQSLQKTFFCRTLSRTFPFPISNSPLCRSKCVVPVWLWQSCPCRWFWAADSFQCVAAHLNTRQWSYDIGHQASGLTSRYPSLSGWPTERYAEERETERKTISVTIRRDFHFVVQCLTLLSVGLWPLI